VFLKTAQTIKKYRKVTSKNDHPGEVASSVTPDEVQKIILIGLIWTHFQITVPGRKRTRFGICLPCSREECGQCKSYMDMKKFGGRQEKAVLWAQKVQQTRKVYSTWQNQCEHTLGHAYIRQAEKALFAINHFVCIAYKVPCRIPVLKSWNLQCTCCIKTQQFY